MSRDATEQELRTIAGEIASVKTMSEQYASQDLRLLNHFLQSAYDEALFQARIAYELHIKKGQ